jgi:hypothetical protein
VSASVDGDVEAILDYAIATRHDPRYTDQGVRRGLEELVDELLVDVALDEAQAALEDVL